MHSLLALAIGFAIAGLLSSGYQLLTLQPASFHLLHEGERNAALVFAPMAYMLWPQGGAIAPDAPSIPVTVGGTVFNVPPAAVRFKVQRRPGAQARIDLIFVWPSLTPPDASILPSGLVVNAITPP